ncbi:MAG: hypothetical protein HRT92_04085 [Piscirickettsiaceae bacterium]|nr:hypothetical protein [Piscirickettsiaceae bacterium]
MNDFFNNASVTAFLGAFFAFALVIVTDRRRLYRKRLVLRNVIADNGDHAHFKLDSVQRNLELVSTGNITPAPIMEFPVQAIQQLQLEVVDILNANQNQAISSLLYWMTEIDRQLNKAAEKAEAVISFERRDPENPEKQHLYGEYKDIMEESEKNLNNVLELIGHYVSGHPELIKEFTHE